MATAQDFLSYTGNAGLGLGSSPEIPISNPKDLDFVNQNLRDIALQDHQNNLLKYKQKIDERDKLYESLQNGQIKVGDTLERDLPTVNSALDQQTQAFQDWMNKGYGDIQGAVNYRRATQKANEVVTQAQARKVFFDKENNRGFLLPKFQQDRTDHLQGQLGNFWGDLTPYEPTSTLDVVAIQKFTQPFQTEVTDPNRPLEKGKRTYFSYNNALKNATDSFLTPEGSYNLSQLHDTLQSMPPLDLYNKVKGINSELARYNQQRRLVQGDPDFATPIQAVPQYDGQNNLTGLALNEPLDKLAAKFSLAGQPQYQNDNWELDKSKQEQVQLGINKENAESNRIRANAAAQRASAYARLQGLKSKKMTDEEKRVKGFWDDIVNKVNDYKLSDGTKDDMVLIGNVPAGYQNIAGLDKDGKPIKLEPLTRGSDGRTKYYDTKYYGGKDGQELQKDFLKNKYNDYKSAGGNANYGDYLKQLIKSGVVDLELVGKNGTANFNTALQTAQSISNKVTKKGEEPLFQGQEEQTTDEENQ